MCGIYGILDKTKIGFIGNDLDILSQMAILTQLRGLHSSGVFAVHKDKPKDPARILKAVGPSHMISWEKGWDSWWKFVSADGGAVVGHGRHATVGKITKANAHPFRHEHITLVHNGTIRGGLDKEHESDVDSHMLCKQIAADGIREALNKALGAYAVIVHDDRDGLIYITRNSERPLHFIEGKDKIYILSERDGLDYLYKRNTGMQYGTIREFQANKLYVFDLTSKELREEGEPVKKYGGTTVYPLHTKWPHQQQSPALPLPNYGQSPKHTILPTGKIYSNGESIEFQVKRILDPSVGSTDYIYLCVDEDGNSLFFARREKDATLVGKWGTGVCASATYNEQTSKWIYQIANRKIEWDVVEVEDDDHLLTVDGEVIPKKDWEKAVKNEVCQVCKETVAIEDNEATLVYEYPQAGQYKLVCRHCLKEHHAGGDDYNKLIAQVSQ